MLEGPGNNLGLLKAGMEARAEEYKYSLLLQAMAAVVTTPPLSQAGLDGLRRGEQGPPLGKVVSA